MPYIDVFKLMEYANNMADKSIDANDIARFPWAEVVEVKHGRWKGEGLGDYMCSLCGAITTHTRTNFCPNSGAHMRKETEDE